MINSNGSFATLDQSAGSGEDVSLVFAAQGAADTTYAKFDFNVNMADLSVLDGQGLYFTHFKDATTAFRARTGVVVPTGGGDYGLAIHADNADLGAGSSWGSDLSFDTWYTAVISWNASSGESKLWVNPVNMASTSVSHTGTLTGTLIEAYSLRQSNDYTGFINIDNVVVGMTFDDVIPEPASLALLSLGGLMMLARRRV